jgi:hypothetical protein
LAGKFRRPIWRLQKFTRTGRFLEPPLLHAGLTATDVLRGETDTQKETMIRKWIKAVWEIWEDRHQWVRAIPDELVNKNR